jgi:hypothetical protein
MFSKLKWLLPALLLFSCLAVAQYQYPPVVQSQADLGLARIITVQTSGDILIMAASWESAVGTPPQIELVKI